MSKLILKPVSASTIENAAPNTLNAFIDVADTKLKARDENGNLIILGGGGGGSLTPEQLVRLSSDWHFRDPFIFDQDSLTDFNSDPITPPTLDDVGQIIFAFTPGVFTRDINGTGNPIDFMDIRFLDFMTVVKDPQTNNTKYIRLFNLRDMDVLGDAVNQPLGSTIVAGTGGTEWGNSSGLPSGLNYQVLHLNGSNVLEFTDKFYDAVGIGSVFLDDRYLQDTSGNRSVDWQSHYLGNNSGVATLYWQSMTMHDSFSLLSVDWGFGRQLYDFNEVSTLDWGNRVLYGEGNTGIGDDPRVSWGGPYGLTLRRKKATYGSGNIAIDWENSTILDTAQNYSILWDTRQLNDSIGNYSLGWQDRKLKDKLTLDSVNWDGRILAASNGNVSYDWKLNFLRSNADNSVSININPRYLQDSSGTVGVDWQNRYLQTSAAHVSVDWQNFNLRDDNNQYSVLWDGRALVDSSNQNALEWSSRSLKTSSGGTSLDWNNRYLKNTSGNNTVLWGDYQLKNFLGVTTLHWENNELTDSSNLRALSWELRRLFDSSGVRSINWNTRELYSPGDNPVVSWDNSGLKINGNYYFPTATGAEGQTMVRGSGSTVSWETKAVTKKINITAGQLATSSTPISIISAPGAGKFINVISVSYKYNAGTTGYAGATDFGVAIDTTSGYLFTRSVGSSALSGTTSKYGYLGRVSGYETPNTITNTPLYFFSDFDFTLGDGNLDIYVTYSIDTF
jgi:hypothetical protein